MFEGLKKKLSHFVDSLATNEKKQEKEKASEEINASASSKEAAETAGANAQPADNKGDNKGKFSEAASKEYIYEQTEASSKRKEKASTQQQAGNTKTIAPGIEITAGTKIKSAIFKSVRIKEGDVDELLDSLQTSLLESDVGYNTTEKIVSDLRTKLIGAVVDSSHIKEQITDIVRNALLDVLNKGTGIDIVSMAESAKASSEPFKILFLGPNGAGKTTTMAKIAKMLIDNGLTCVLSASDTFRAAAIEQTVHHAGKLGINVIKGTYGADPASVAFDAIAFAKSHGINVVLIDSAGRQETNKSLMEEVKKMARVAKPNLKIFIGESISGSALIDQILEFDSAVKLDGVILTKVDCDAKGGNTLSILSESSIPILFFGTGEGYSDIIKYSPDIVIKNILVS